MPKSSHEDLLSNLVTDNPLARLRKVKLSFRYKMTCFRGLEKNINLRNIKLQNYTKNSYDQ